MDIIVDIKESLVTVECRISITKAVYEFALATNWKIDSFMNNGKVIKGAKNEQCFMQFRPAMTRYTVEGLSAGDLIIEYSGVPQGNFAFMTDHFIHFSFYNGWYPVGYDVVEEYTAMITVGDEYSVLKGEYDFQRKQWKYVAPKQAYMDCNIICFNKEKAHIAESENVSIYWFDDEKTELAYGIFNEYGKICEYYCHLYGNNKMAHTDIVFVPGDYQMGAYMREGLIVFTDMNMALDDILHILGHEIGHSYASGADASTYHDWLNETHAEWSALLYAAENHPDVFDKVIKRYEDNVLENGNKLMLKERGDNRPDNVHITGTMIYYGIYKQFGAETVAELLRIFDRLEVRDTNTFMEKVSEYKNDVADLLYKHLYNKYITKNESQLNERLTNRNLLSPFQ